VVSLRSGAATVLTLFLIASSQGCGTDESREGPPFEPGDIQGPESLLITNSDIEGADASTPYGAVLRWWQAFQLGDAKQVRRSYAERISKGEARRQIDGFHSRFSQPIDPEVRTHGELATVKVRIRTAAPFAGTPNIVSIKDFNTQFYLVGGLAGWRLRPVSYENYTKARRHARLAVR
jgi:hypothetical protein